jgi:hypothetical protein
MTKTSSVVILGASIALAGASGLYLYNRYLATKAASLEAELEALRLQRDERRILLFKFGLGTIGVGLSVLFGVRAKKYIADTLFGGTPAVQK